MNNSLEVKNLCKKYNEFELKNINLKLPKGMIMGLIGENGAGKTTTIKSILNLINIDNGEIVLSKTRDELLEKYGIVKCSKSEFEKIDKNDYVKFKVNRYEYDVLVEDKAKFKRKYEFKIIDKPTLDDIMLIYIKGEK